MNRRGFLAACLAFGAAPAIVRASSLMPVRDIRVATFDELTTLVSMHPPTSATAILTLREQAYANLAFWWGAQWDRLALDYLTAQNAPPLQFNRIERVA
jgi:hypothetical protein